MYNIVALYNFQSLYWKWIAKRWIWKFVQIRYEIQANPYFI